MVFTSTSASTSTSVHLALLSPSPVCGVVLSVFCSEKSKKACSLSPGAVCINSLISNVSFPRIITTLEELSHGSQLKRQYETKVDLDYFMSWIRSADESHSAI
ncbi:hypothetical protein BDF14DRAFT_1773949 [Spinellus fusiger]|nr:hypothetical protein BDF14DRAFT_1773949 [Spinellus fusiger]